MPTTLTGKKLLAVTHSFGLEPGVLCTPGQEWTNQLIARASMTAGRIGYAANGARPAVGAINVLSRATFPTSFVVGSAGLAVIEFSGADYRFGAGAALVANMAGSVHAYRAMIAAFQAASIVQTTSAWSLGDSTLTNNSFWGNGVLHFTSTNSSVLTVTVDWTLCLGGVAYLMTLIESGNTRIMTVKLDGVSIATFDKTAQCSNAGVSNKAVIKLTGLPTSGSHVLTVENSATGAGNVSVEAVIYPSATPIPVLVIKDPYFRTTDEQTVFTSKPSFDAGVDSVTSEFTNCYPIDLGFGGWWDPDLHLGSDRNHPNDPGMLAITNRMSQVLLAKGL